MSLRAEARAASLLFPQTYSVYQVETQALDRLLFLFPQTRPYCLLGLGVGVFCCCGGVLFCFYRIMPFDLDHGDWSC